jgi:hypothetical protein
MSNVQRLSQIVIKTLEMEGGQPLADLLGALESARIDLTVKFLKSLGFVQMPTGVKAPEEEEGDDGA